MYYVIIRWESKCKRLDKVKEEAFPVNLKVVSILTMFILHVYLEPLDNIIALPYVTFKN